MDKELSRRKFLKYASVAGMLAGCAPKLSTEVPAATGKVPKNTEPVEDPTTVSMATVAAVSTIESTQTPVRMETDIYKEEIAGDLPEILRQKTNEVVEVKDMEGRVYAREAYAKLPVGEGGSEERVLMMVKPVESPQWQLAPYGLGLPEGNSIFHVWAETADSPGRKIWSVEKPLSSTTPEKQERRNQILEIENWLIASQPEHFGTAKMLMPDFFNADMKISEHLEDKMYKQFLQSNLDSNFLERSGFWDQRGNKPMSVDEYIAQLSLSTRAGDESGTVGWEPGFRYMGSNDLINVVSEVHPPEGAYIGQLDCVFLTRRDVAANPYARVFFDKLTESGGSFFGELTQDFGLAVYPYDSEGHTKMLFVVADSYVDRMGVELAGKQSLADIEGNLTDLSSKVATAMFNVVTIVNAEKFLGGENNDRVYSKRVDPGGSLYPVTTTDDVKEPYFEIASETH